MFFAKKKGGYAKWAYLTVLIKCRMEMHFRVSIFSLLRPYTLSFFVKMPDMSYTICFSGPINICYYSKVWAHVCPNNRNWVSILHVFFPCSIYKGQFVGLYIYNWNILYGTTTDDFTVMRRSGLQASLDACSAAVHEFRIPPKALLGVHSYCPVHFDTFHSVLVDTTVHISLLKSGSNATPKGLR